MLARLMIITALLMPFYSYPTVVSPEASAQTEQEEAVIQLSIEKMIRYPELVDQLYDSTNYRLTWQNPDNVARFEFQLQLLILANISPLFDEQYHRIELVKRHGDKLDYDLVMTDSLLMYLSYVEQVPQQGLTWLFSVNQALSLPAPSSLSLARLSDDITVGQLDRFLAGLMSPLQADPDFKRVYDSLQAFSRQALANYEQQGLTRVGDTLDNKAALLDRMAVVGVEVVHLRDMGGLFDQELELAVKEFQRIHGLKQDGIIGPNTLRWLNFTPEQRLHSLALNAERSRIWAQERDNVVFVNVPGFEVTYWHQGEPLFESKVVVGRTSRKTPIMTSKLDAVILNPTWNVPWKIMVKDILPKVKRNPMYLIENNIQVIRSWSSFEVIDPTTINWSSINPRTFPYRMRQLSGTHNALGLYKFNMPNPKAIYMHDTPSKNLFEEDRRAFSSGCVRVQNADQFAELLFKIQGLEELLASRQQEPDANTSVPLGQRIPVHIIYQTAWLEDGTLYYRDDIYHYDRQG